ncbi:uncharacterized protein LOC143022696 [Oratosquilla oratoria]|uniref:uncharacterized protein LOC143022696 n=1 Tax=Oratosquilla oratoria TaxID=337810 RepID=UPI003F775243
MLSIAKTVYDKASGHLAMVQAMWTNPTLVSNKTYALQSVTLAKKLIEKEKIKNGSVEPLLLELEAMTGFWLYLCKLQIIQEKTLKEVIDTNKTESLSVRAVDPGEEMQANDSCDVRPTLQQHVNTYAQAQTLIALNDALAIWEELVLKGAALKEGEEACKCLMSTAFVYRLCGLLEPEVRSWATLITLARRENLLYYVIKGLSELMLAFPEMVPQHLAEELKVKMENNSALEDSTSSGRDQTSTQTLQLTAKAALAFYYLRTGQYTLGAGYLQELREEKALEKRTVRLTEVSVLVNYIASLYAWLPSWVATGAYRPSEPVPFLSLYACREAFALIECSESTTSEYICWRHRIVWLFFLTTSWLGEVCLTIAEPRLARACLKESLVLAQKLALPLRIGEIIEILARVDALTNLWTDCEVKVDSLQNILLPHVNGKENLQFEYSPSNKTLSQNCSSKITNKENVLQEKEDNQKCLLKIECIPEDEFSLQPVDQSKGIVIGSEDRVHNLIDSDIHLSPSLKFRQENSKLRLPECSEGLLDCVSCSSPLHQDLCLALAYLTANVHTSMNRTSYAMYCIKQGLKSYKNVCEKSWSLAESLCTKVGQIGLEACPPSQLWFTVRLHKTYLLLLLFEVEILILEGDWNAAREKNILVLQTFEMLDSWMLFYCIHLFVIVAQQGYRICAAQAESQCVQTHEESDQESKSFLTLCKEVTSSPKTPVQSARQGGDKMGAVKSARCSSRKARKVNIIINKVGRRGESSPMPKRKNSSSTPVGNDTISSSQWNLLKQTPATVRLRKKCTDPMGGLEVGLEKLKLKEDSEVSKGPGNNTNTATSTAESQVKTLGIKKGRRPKNSAQDLSEESSADSSSPLSPSSSDNSGKRDSSSENGVVFGKAVHSSRRVVAAATRTSRSVNSRAASKTTKEREAPVATTTRSSRSLRRVLR